jgi:RecB family exonuclease
VPTLCLFPTPLRAARASRRLCDAEGGILFGARATTLAALAPGVLAAAGDRRRLLTPLAEELLAVEAGRGAGGSFAGLSASSGLARALASALAELRRGEVTAAVAAGVARELPGRAGARLGELASALARYEERLAALGALDGAAALRAAAEAVRRGAGSEETRGLSLLVVEGFTKVSPAEWDLLAALAARADRSLFRLPFFPERADACGPVEPLLRRVEGLHEVAARREVSIGFAALDERAPALVEVLRAVAGGQAPAGTAAREGALLAASGPGAEGAADAAARLAARLLDSGLAPDDLCLVAARTDAAGPLLARAFAAHGVPLAGVRPGPLAEAPPVQAVREALLAAPRLTRRAAERLATSSYLGLAPLPARLSHWLDRAGAIDGRNLPEEALRRRAALLEARRAAPERAALLRAAEALAEVSRALAPQRAPAAPRERARLLRSLVERAGVRRRAARAEPEVARRDLAAVAALEEAADDLSQALALCGRAEERLGLDDYLPLLDLAAARAAAPGETEPAAGAVEIWPLSEAAGLSARGAILVGCGREGFPGAPAPEPLLRDPERLALNRALSRAALATGGARRAEAAHRAFCALAAGREAVGLVWEGDGPEGSGESPGPLVLEALAVAGVPLAAAARPEPSLPESRTAAEALRAAARLARDGHRGAAAEALRETSPELAARAEEAALRGDLESERREAMLARAPSPAAGLLPPALRPALAAALPAEWSPTQLETFARCPYQLFLKLLLKLPDREAADLDIDPRDEGQLVHAVMEKFLSGRLARGAFPLSGAEADQEEAREVALALFARFEAEGRVGDPAVWAARREAVLARVARVVEAEGRDADGLVPRLLEHRFGGEAEEPPLAIPDGGETVLLQGRIDRVDGGAGRLLVLDYKNARRGGDHQEKLEPEALGEVNFQVPAYLLAAARALPGAERLEASYLLLRSAERAEPYRVAAGDGFFALDEARRAELRAAGERNFADLVTGAVRRIRAGEFPIASRSCKGCGFGAVCRFQATAEEAAP